MSSTSLGSIFLPAGTVLGGAYRVEGALGKPGGFGITYLAEDTRLQARVAVKEFFPRGLARRAADGRTVVPTTPDDAPGFDHARARFLDEARMLERFRHPAIVRVRAFFEENGTAYLVMDYLDGRTLSAHLERAGGHLSADTTLAIVRPLLEALGEIHAAGVLHRDVDPANIYITNRHQVVLLDFGAARQAVAKAEGDQRSLSVVLKPGYAPYEQYASRGRQGPWTDLYALSATMYRMLTGLVPQESTSRIMHDEVRSVEEVVGERYGERLPEGLSRAVMWGLSLRPEDRPQSVEAFAKVLEGAAAAPAGYAPPLGAGEAGATRAYSSPPLPPGYALPLQGDFSPTVAHGGYVPIGPDSPSYTPQPVYGGHVPSYMQEPPRRSIAGPLIGALLVLALLGGGFFVLTQRPDLVGLDTPGWTPPTADPGTSPSGPDVRSSDPGTARPDPAPVVSTKPRSVNQVPPVYPQEAADAGLSGRVLVKVMVDTDGSVHDVTIEESTNPVFDDAAMKAAWQWTFEPATRDGQPVQAPVIIPFDFNN